MQVLAARNGGTTRIRVNSVNPGPTRTAMRRQAYPAEDAAAMPEPAAVLAPFLYLLGPASVRASTGRRSTARLAVTPRDLAQRVQFVFRELPAAAARERAIHGDRPVARAQDAVGFEAAVLEERAQIARPQARTPTTCSQRLLPSPPPAPRTRRLRPSTATDSAAACEHRDSMSCFVERAAHADAVFARTSRSRAASAPRPARRPS